LIREIGFAQFEICSISCHDLLRAGWKNVREAMVRLGLRGNPKRNLTANDPGTERLTPLRKKSTLPRLRYFKVPRFLHIK
jgi:hypothetical protein